MELRWSYFCVFKLCKEIFVKVDRCSWFEMAKWGKVFSSQCIIVSDIYKRNYSLVNSTVTKAQHTDPLSGIVWDPEKALKTVVDWVCNPFTGNKWGSLKTVKN